MSDDRKDGRREIQALACLTVGRVDLRDFTKRVATLCRDSIREIRRFGADLSRWYALGLANSDDARRRSRRTFRPGVGGGGLEPRYLLSNLPGSYFLKHPSAAVALKANNPPQFSPGAPRPAVTRYPRGGVSIQTAHGGQSVIVATAEGHFKISLTQFIQPAGEGTTSSSSSGNVPGTQTPIQGVIPGSGVVQPIGTVRAYKMAGGKVGIIVDGSTTQTELDISPLPFPQRKGYAHSFAYGQSSQSHVLNVGQITINTGEISAILGYHTADLSGPLTATGSTAIDRIAFQDLLPGASITTGSDLNTLDVLNTVDLSGGPGISIGRDLNLINVGQNLSLTNGSSLTVGRFLGTTPQPPKGTATGSNLIATNQALVGTGSTTTTVPSLSGYIQGNLIIGSGSTFSVASGIANSSVTTGSALTPSVFLVNGNVQATSASQIAIPNIAAATSFTAGANFVARNGFNISGP